MTKNARVLVVAYGGGHINAVLPVIEKLRTQGNTDVIVLGLTTAANVLQRAGISCLGFRHFLNDADGAAIATGQRLAHTVPSGSGVSHAESIAYLGLSYVDLVERVGEEQAAAQYAARGRQAFLPVGILRRVFETLRPDLVLATNSPRAERAAILVAREKSIPSICLADLFLGHELEWIRSNEYADRLLVLSDFVKQRVVSAGRKPESIYVTGNPAFDRLADPVWKSEATRIRIQRGWNGRKVILWISHPMPWHPPTRDQIKEALIEACMAHEDWQLVLRSHPSEPDIPLPALPRVTVSNPNTDLVPALLHATDAAVTMLSTMGLEAALLGVPLVLTDIVPYVETGAIDPQGEMFLKSLGLGIVANSLDQISSSVERALVERPNYRDMLPRIGGATNAVLNHIREMLG